MEQQQNSLSYSNSYQPVTQYQPINQNMSQNENNNNLGVFGILLAGGYFIYKLFSKPSIETIQSSNDIDIEDPNLDHLFDIDVKNENYYEVPPDQKEIDHILTPKKHRFGGECLWQWIIWASIKNTIKANLIRPKLLEKKGKCKHGCNITIRYYQMSDTSIKISTAWHDGECNDKTNPNKTFGLK